MNPQNTLQSNHVIGKILKNFEIEKARKYLVERRGDPLEAIPGNGGVVNVYFVVEALSDLVLRHEGGDDLVEVSVAGYSVPAITDSKLDGSYRRTATQEIGYVFKEYGDEIRSAIIATLNQLMNSSDSKTRAIALALFDEKYARLKILDKPYSCAIRPYGVGGKEYVTGNCRECPTCFMFGFAVPEEGEEGASKTVKVEVDAEKEKKTISLEIGSYNVQARVRGDLYPATAPSNMITGIRTHNSVDDATKTTGQALITIRYVRAGSTFVGKIALYDVSLNELLFLLAILSKVPRIGAMWSDYGKVKIHIPAILFADQEVGSGYEIARRILKEEFPKKNMPLSVEETINAVMSFASEFKDFGYLYVDKELTDRLFKLNREDMKEIIKNAWIDTIKLRVSYEHFTT